MVATLYRETVALLGLFSIKKTNMKYILVAALGISTLSSFAQSSATDTAVKASAASAAAISVSAVPATITIDTQQGPLTVMIPQAGPKAVQKDWAHYVGQGSTGKTANADGQFTQYGAVNKNISASPFNITARFLGTSDGVKLSVWLSDNNNFENSKQPGADRSLALQKYVRDFAVAEYRQAVSDELKGSQIKLKDLESDLTKLNKQEDKDLKRTEENKRGIVKAKDAIAVNDRDIKSANDQIESQKGMVQTTAADKNAAKGAKKTLSQLEGDKRDLQKKNEKEGKNIVAREAEIRADERGIADIKAKQTAKATEIDKQKQVVQTVQAKLDGIH
jgi:hypothetical protein